MARTVLADTGAIVAALHPRDQHHAWARECWSSLSDPCLVRMSEIHDDCRVFTTDSDFVVYRRWGRQVIPLLAPW